MVDLEAYVKIMMILGGETQRGITRGHKCNGDTFRGKNEGIEGNLKGG